MFTNDMILGAIFLNIFLMVASALWVMYLFRNGIETS